MNRPRRTIVLLALVTTAGGCVTRQVTVTSQPSGALVYMNDREVGRTPFTTDFTWYGDYDFVVRKEGFETIKKSKRITAPWWQFFPIDFFAEIAPWRPVDKHALNFTMRETPADVSPRDIVTRGLALQLKLPSTQPAK